ncbi:hypothetical protein SAMN05216466_10758 [Paraburkholderia phenazinium]|uniref:Uncharacterized protein n=1 Tax=Paraburkholderia phenazinium TaxID=60549 RepID=A0A1G7ZJP8_9BURK|nr:hypothetical protein SAMN05216466_10758 [Paraburkholderia phenazinium]
MILFLVYNPGMETKPKHPGGRPRLPDEQKQVQRSIRLSPELWAKIDAYGLDWLRQLIQRAKPPPDK